VGVLDGSEVGVRVGDEVGGFLVCVNVTAGGGVFVGVDTNSVRLGVVVAGIVGVAALSGTAQLAKTIANRISRYRFVGFFTIFSS